MNHAELARLTSGEICPKCQKLLKRGPREKTITAANLMSAIRAGIIPPCPRCGYCGFIEDADMNLAGVRPECNGAGRALIRHNRTISEPEFQPTMNQTDTPETDDARQIKDSRGVTGNHVATDFARRMERERDEARKIAAELRDLVPWSESEPWNFPWQINESLPPFSEPFQNQISNH